MMHSPISTTKWEYERRNLIQLQNPSRFYIRRQQKITKQVLIEERIGFPLNVSLKEDKSITRAILENTTAVAFKVLQIQKRMGR